MTIDERQNKKMYSARQQKTNVLQELAPPMMIRRQILQKLKNPRISYTDTRVS